MTETMIAGPDETAARVALWRVLHLEIDLAPPVFQDEIGLKLLAPEQPWRRRSDMAPLATRGFRAAIVARARFVEDLVSEQCQSGIDQYVILGAGLDTFAQRRPELASRMRVFEVDRPQSQDWKRQRLVELGFGVPDWLRFVPVDFEAGENWWERLAAAGFDPHRPAFVASTGVSLYLSREANATTMHHAARLAPGSTLAMTYIRPRGCSDPSEHQGYEAAERGARAAGTPFVSFFTPAEIGAMAHAAGFRDWHTVSAADLAKLYFTGRADGLQPPAEAEEFLVATT